MAWFLRFGIMRLRAKWRSLLTLIIGVLLASLIGANASLYTTAISQVGMVEFLADQPPDDTAILTRIGAIPFDIDNLPQYWESLDAQVIAEANLAFDDVQAWTGELIRYAETQPLIPVKNGEDIPDTRFRLAYYDFLSEYIEIIDGELPQTSLDNTIQAEVLMNAEAAVLSGIEIGDIIELDQRGWDSSQIFTVRVSGLIRPLDNTSAYWFDPSPLRFATAGRQIETNLLTTREALETIPVNYIPETSIQIGWRIAPDHTQLPFTQVDTAAAQIEAFSIGLNDLFLSGEESSNSYFFTTNLVELFDSYDEQIVFLNIPFALILLQLSALILFFLMLIAALVRRGERREIAMFQSRGATDAQIIAARSIESFLICLFATLIAPFLAQIILQWFIPLLTGIQRVPLELNLQVFLFAGLASLVAFIALTLTLFPVMRQPLVSAGGVGSRSGTQTWWQRYYLDVILLIIGVVALYQLTQSQSLLADTVTESVEVDPLLLIAPTLLFVAFSSVLLRFFPITMSMIARFFSNQRGLEGALASWQVSREPLHYGRIAFLLALAIGIGWFAVSYQATLVGNQIDQAAYLVGGDIRLIYDNPESPDVTESMNRIANLPDVQASSQLTRLELTSVVASTGSGRRTRQAGDLLIVNSNSLQEIVSWRRDLGDLSLPETDFDTTIDIGTAIPAGTQRIGFRVQIVSDANIQFGRYSNELSPYPMPLLSENVLNLRIQSDTENWQYTPALADTQPVEDRLEELQAELEAGQNLWQSQDSDGDGTLDFVPRYEWQDEGWVYFEADLSELDTPVNLFAIDVFFISNGFFSQLEMSFSEFQFIAEDGTIIESQSYDALDVTVVSGQNTTAPGTMEVIESQDNRFGESILLGRWSTNSGFNAPNTVFALLFNYPEYATVDTNALATTESTEEEIAITGMPVLLSSSMAEINELTVDGRFNLVINNVSPWFTVERIVDFYPTLFQERPYIVVEESLYNYTMQRATGQSASRNELWIRLNPGVDESQFLSDLRLSDDAPFFAEIISFEETIRAGETDVLSLGVIGLLFISFVVGLALSIVSLLTYITLTVQSRISEFAVLRALGLTTTRMILAIMIEQILVLIASIILGAAIGQFLTLQVLPPLALSAAGGTVTPPFTLIVDFVAIAQYLLIILLVLAVVLVMSAIAVRRTATADALRLTEE